jgi:predicted aldo/keto reductase-like oxidoreductase
MYAARLGGAVGTGEPSYASLCVQCRECVDTCPQHIDIPAVLESVVNELEGPGFDERVAMARQLFKESSVPAG